MRIEEGWRRRNERDRRGIAAKKVIVRSNGVVTYVGKDIANQFWKFGLLGRDFRYRRFANQADGHVLWSTTAAEGEPHAPSFGGAKRIYNVIDSRQMYLQALLSQALRALGHPEEAENSIHFSYEMVALSHSTARELGYPEAERRRGQETVRRSVWPQRPRSQNRRPPGPVDREGVCRSREAESRVLRR